MTTDYSAQELIQLVVEGGGHLRRKDRGKTLGCEIPITVAVGDSLIRIDPDRVVAQLKRRKPEILEILAADPGAGWAH